jgi:hypothetical protein
MRADLHDRRMTLYGVARIIIAAALAVALVSGAAPLGSASAGHLCAMACCAGQPPHEAGSCTHGSCQVSFSVPEPPPPPEEQEELCGAPQPRSEQHHAARTTHAPHAPPANVEDVSPAAHHRHHAQADSAAREHSHGGDSRQPPFFNASVLDRPCPPDCGAATSVYSSQSRPRDSAAVSHADRARPPSGPRLRQTSYHSAGELDALCRRSRPRGPPPSFS